MLSIQTNVNSLVAQQNLSVNTAFQSKTITQLTSGYRINSSGDDAAGLSVANKFRSSVAELTQGVANGNDGVAQLQIMDGGMNNISQILDRLKTLATQSATGTLTGTTTRATLNSEFQTDLGEIDRQAQSIGLDTGGLFAKSLDVYLGTGSGSSSLSNGIVTVNLTQSAVDSQSLGLKGMQSLNLTDIGSTSSTSVQDIVGNTSGANANQEATAGYASLQFSGAGFSDAGKVSISVNLSGVTDVGTLVTAVNSAIQAAGEGGTSAATMFKNANIVASVNTDSSGGQELAFTSSSAAFQVQAGDQMGNALLGNVAVVGGVAQGTAVTGTAATKVTGAATTAGNFGSTQVVKLVVTGGGLASPVTLQLNTGASGVNTSGAITDLENQFASNSALSAAGLTMSGSSTVGGTLSFDSASGQGFNVQVTGDTSNLLGLGSFLTDHAGNADYSTITATSAYSATALTGNATTTGLGAGLEVSLNGGASVALTPIDLTTGAHAVAASVTGGAIAGGSVDISTTTNNLDITVTNNGAVDHQAWALNTTTGPTGGTSVSSVTSTAVDASGITIGAGNDEISIAVDGGAAVKVKVADATYTTAASFLQAVNSAISGTSLGTSVTASWDATNSNKLTLSTAATGANHSLNIVAATDATGAGSVSTLTSASFGGPVTVSAANHNDKFDVSVNGAAAVTVQLTAGTYTTATTFLQAVNDAISGTSLGTTVTAAWDATNSNKLTLTTAGTGAGASLNVSATTYNTGAASVSTLTSASYGGPVTVSAANHNNKFDVSVNGAAAVTVQLTTGTYSTAASFLQAVNDAISGTSLGTTVTAAWDATNSNKLTLTTAGTGAGASLNISATTYGTMADVRSATLTSGNFTSTTIDGTNDSFNLSVDGGPSVLVQIAQATYTTASSFLLAINNAIGSTSLGTNVSASWDATASNLMTFTSATSTSGVGSSVSISGVAGNGGRGVVGFTVDTTGHGASATNTGMATTLGLTAGFHNGQTGVANSGMATTLGLTAGYHQGNSAAANTGLGTMGITAGIHFGTADQPATVQSIASQIQAKFGSAALVSVTNGNQISIASTTKGSNSSVVINTPATNSANAVLHLDAGSSPTVVNGQNSSIQDIVDNLNAQFAASSTLKAAGLTAAATASNGTGTGNYLTISSSVNNNTQFRLNSLGGGGAATAGAVASTVTSANIVTSPITVSTGVNDQFKVAVDGGTARTLTVGAGTYSTAAGFLTAVQSAISSNTFLSGTVTAGWDATTHALTLTSASTGNNSSVALTAVNGNTGLTSLGFSVATGTGQQVTLAEDTGFGTSGTTFTAAAPSSTGTTMSAQDANGISNSQAFTFSAMKYGTDKQAITFSATDSNGVLETKTITLQNNTSTNRAGVSIDDAVAYINQQLQQSTDKPALQSIVAVKENVNGAEGINFVSSLSGFTVGVAATANGDGLNGGTAVYRDSQTLGSASTISIDTQAGAKSAITAIVNAVSALGSAQAAVGKGENQLNYAITLAQSQITNFSSAEAQIRDSDVAAQAANLSKAQVLQQATIAAMAQANSAPQAVLSLLKG